MSSKFDDLNAAIQQLFRSFRDRASLQPNGNPRFRNNLEDCLHSANRLVASASTTHNSRTISNSSELGDRNGSRTGLWVNQQTRVLDNSDLEIELIQGLRRSATLKFDEEDFSAAEIFLEWVLKRSEDVCGPEFEWHDSTLEMLATTYCKLGKWEEAEKTLLEVLKNKTDDDSTETLFRIAEVYKGMRDLESAEEYGRRALVQTMQRDVQAVRHKTIRLLVSIFEAKGDLEKSEAFKSLLPEELQGNLSLNSITYQRISNR